MEENGDTKTLIKTLPEVNTIYSKSSNMSTGDSVLSGIVSAITSASACTKKYVLRRNSNVSSFIWGILIGILVTTMFVEQNIILSYVSSQRALEEGLLSENFIKSSMQQTSAALKVQTQQAKAHSPSESVKNKVYVGVLTAKKYLPTRSKAVYETWGKQTDKINFFVGSEGGDDNVKYSQNLPVIFLKGTSDVDYPPQKKMFAMLKHICKYHINDFEWFLRADDDLYFRPDRFKQVVSKIDSDKMLFMGQHGNGHAEMRDKLGLDGHNFCMGGPGVFLNQIAMKSLCPHLDECEANVASNEEDVEIGRCVTKHLHIECTNNWETMKLFYHSYSSDFNEDRPFQGNLLENNFLKNAVTLHYLKLPLLMYRVHRHYNVIKHLEMAEELKNMTKDLSLVRRKVSGFYEKDLNLKSLNPVSVLNRRNVLEWKTLTMTSQLSTSQIIKSDDLIGNTLVDVKQSGERAIDVSVMMSSFNADVTKAYYDYVVVGYKTCYDITDGCSYFYDVILTTDKDKNIKQLRRVELKRPLSSDSKIEVSLEIEDEKKLVLHDYYVIVLTYSGSDLQSFLRDVTIPSHVTILACPHQSTNTEKPTVSEVVQWWNFQDNKIGKPKLVAMEESTNTETALSNALKWLKAKPVTSSEKVISVVSAKTKVANFSQLLTECATVTSERSVYRPVLLRTPPNDSAEAELGGEVLCGKSSGFYEAVESDGFSVRGLADGDVDGFEVLQVLLPG